VIKVAVVLIILGGVVLISPASIIRIISFILQLNNFSEIPNVGVNNPPMDKKFLHKSGASLIFRVLGAILMLIGIAGLIYEIKGGIIL
jgi:hypothetical protein